MRLPLALALTFVPLALAAADAPAPASAKTLPTPPPAPWLLSKEERQRQEQLANADRQRLMDLLGIAEPKNLPPEESDPKRPAGLTRPANNPNGWTDAAGRFVVRSPWGNWINYDLTKAATSPLPDPLLLANGQPVTNAATWTQQRRPEIAEIFAREIYGRIPAETPKITWEVTAADPQSPDSKVTTKQIVGRVDNAKLPSASPAIFLTLHLPADAKGPVPVMVAIGGFGPPPGFAGPKGPTAMDLVLAQGWGYATYNPYAVQADTGAGLTEGIIGLVNEGKPRQPDQWGALAAWSWGLSRAIDYLDTDPAVDARRLGVEGHSRFGKTALLAAALEPRWAIAYASCSGEGGAKLHRHDYGESVDIVAWGGEYHWMAGNFLKYAGHWQDLPIDQHELIALVAPRPIFITGGTEDLWPDPVGMFEACVAAGPVYRLLGQADVGATAMPAPDVALITGDIGFRLHTGGHTDLPDWPAFLQFAGKYFAPAKP
ncbi:MAG: acetylxylan esterase [Opitutaceae bacterium]|nr:acetylxylan esterase [Opitutaceae bacterium]